MEDVEEHANTQLSAADEAIARGDFQAAYDLLTAAAAGAPLDAARLMALSQAAYCTGRLEETFEALEGAYHAAVEVSDDAAAAQAATQLAIHLMIDTGLLAPIRAWLRRAERRLEGAEETPLHAWIAVVHACERWLSGDFAASRAWATTGIEIGDRHSQAGPATFARVAYARCEIFDGEIERGLELLDDAAERLVSEDIDPLTAGCLYCELVCIWQGLALFDRAEEWTDAMERFSRDEAIGSISGRCRIHKAEILRLRGHLADAEDEVLGACEELRPYMRYEFGWPLTELGRIRETRGDLDGARDAFVEAHEMGWDPQPGLALLRLRQGDGVAALASINAALDNPVNVPSKERPPNSDLRRAPLFAAQAEIAVAVGELELARGAAEEVARIADAFGSKALEAAAAQARGRLALAEEDPSAARRELQTAVRLWSEIPAPYEAAVARTVLADAFIAEGNTDDAELEQRAASATFERLGVAREVARVGPRRAAPRSDFNEFRREGEYWSVAFAGSTVKMKDAKGMRYLGRLLAVPGRELHALDLVARERGDEVDPGSAELATRTDSDAGEVLDEQGKAVYRRRIEDIEEDIAEAQTFGDLERVRRCEAERDFIVRELSRAVGLAGRDRRAGAFSERARASVTRAIRNALDRIREQHPDLAEHLDVTIQTGTFCSYNPDPRVPIAWSV